MVWQARMMGRIKGRVVRRENEMSDRAEPNLNRYEKARRVQCGGYHGCYKWCIAGARLRPGQSKDRSLHAAHRPGSFSTTRFDDTFLGLACSKYGFAFSRSSFANAHPPGDIALSNDTNRK